MTACSTLLSEIGFRGLLHLREDERADLARAVLLALHLDPSIAVRTGHDLVRDHSHVLLRDRVVVAPADQTLDREDGVFRIGDALPLGGLADENLAAVREGNHRRRRSCALGILDHFGLVAFHDGNARVGRSEIDPDCLGHDESPVQRVLRGGARDDRTCQPSAALGAAPSVLRPRTGTCSVREERPEHVPRAAGSGGFLDFDLLGFAARRLRNGDLQHAVRHGGLNLRWIDPWRQLKHTIEHAVASFVRW